MAIQVDVQNFKVLKSVRLYDDAKFSIVLGYNETGKTSLISAIQFALTGTALGKRGKDTKKFVSHGAERMAIRVKIGHNIFCRTQSTGDDLKGIAERLCVPSDVLPLLFDAKLNGDGGSKAMKAFLDGCASTSFDPLVHFANDPRVKPMVEQARAAGKLTTKHIIDYCESMRAAQKAPPQPVLPTNPRPTDAELADLQKDNEQAQNEWRAKIRETQDAVKLGQQLAEIIHYLKAVEVYEKTKASAAIVDPLKDRREKLTKLQNVNRQTVQAIQRIAEEAGFKTLAETASQLDSGLEATIQSVSKLLKDNPPPIPLPEPPMLSTETQQLFDSLLNEGATEESIREMFAGSATITNEARLNEQSAHTIKQQMQMLYDEAQRLRGAWDAYNEQLPLWDDAKAKTAAEWDRWDFGAKEIAAAEIAHINKTGDAFGNMVSEFSQYVLKGKKVKISRDEGIFVGVDPIEDLSESTKWRVEVAVMAAVARTLKSPLLLIDGADILDVKNRQLISQFLLERIVPFFEHTIITSTPRGLLEEEKPIEQATKWLLREGELIKLEAAPTSAAAS